MEDWILRRILCRDCQLFLCGVHLTAGPHAVARIFGFKRGLLPPDAIAHIHTLPTAEQNLG
jgi:hypothetical protein